MVDKNTVSDVRVPKKRNTRMNARTNSHASYRYHILYHFISDIYGAARSDNLSDIDFSIQGITATSIMNKFSLKRTDFYRGTKQMPLRMHFWRF